MGDVIPLRRRSSGAARSRSARRPASDSAPDRAFAREDLWRTLAGEQLRSERRRRGETLAEVAARAGISVQYLSELERGRKEPSSEVLAAVSGAMGVTLLDLTVAVARELHARRVAAGRPSGPVALAA